MDDVKRVKVDNWGIYFLQRLKHFFNRTDFCDLTLQFQDKAQLKVHRLVLSACTEYFEVLERTCEMYEDCLVMPDDLQADVVVPIVNFMYTGHLEFKMDLLEKLYLTSQVMRMPVLTKLLEAHRVTIQKPARFPKSYSKPVHRQSISAVPSSSVSIASKRSYSKAFENNTLNKLSTSIPPLVNQNSSSYYGPYVNKKRLAVPKPTRYEIPEELESDELDDSFTNISYDSKPLMIHLENNKGSQAKRNKISSNSSTKEILHGTSTVKIIDNIGQKMSLQSNSIFDEDSLDYEDKNDLFQTTLTSVRNTPQQSTGQLFDDPLDLMPKVTLETSDPKQSNLDHAKIISEVLKKYPHLVGSNKNIKLKILNTGKSAKSTPQQSKAKKFETMPIELESKIDKPDYVETDILDAKKAAKLISLGAQNIKGPWVCLICGTPGKAILFKSYYTFRRHLVEVHNEKPLLKICEYCGANTPKRNYMFHHLLTKHGIEPPSNYSFPKCNMCDYVGLTEALLIKHKVSHTESKIFKCNVCTNSFPNSASLLIHIQKTGHKYTSEKKCDLQCIYCLRVFTRKANLYAHIKTNHKQLAKLDGIIEESDEEKQDVIVKSETNHNSMQYEFSMNYEQPSEETQTILNSGFPVVKSSKVIQKPKIVKQTLNKPPENLQNDNREEMPDDHILVTIDGEEYMVKHNQLIPHPKSKVTEEYVLSDLIPPDETTITNSLLQNPSTSVEFGRKHETRYLEAIPSKLNKKTSRNIEQPIQIVVSNDEDYKALMSTNHSIIFDDIETNKTLTVLTTAETTNLNSSTIDMDVAQSNEMMILPGNYPLDVSSAVTTNNSNIVVVYSHPQEVPPEFVPSAAVHYETISPATTIINTDAMQQDSESWQNEIQQNTGLQTVNEPIALIEHNNEAQQQGKELRDLPEVQLMPQTDMSQTYTQEEVILSQTYPDDSQNVDSSDIGNIAEEEVTSVSTLPIEVIVPAELHAVQDCGLTEIIKSSEMQGATVEADMPQFEEKSLSVCEVSQEINNMQITTIQSSSNIEDISAVHTKNTDDIHKNVEISDTKTNELAIDVTIAVTSSNVEVRNGNDIKNTLDTIHVLQNNTPQETSNDTNQVFEDTAIENQANNKDAEVEISSVTQEVLRNSTGSIPNNPEVEISSDFVQLSQGDFDTSQQLQGSIEVSQTAEIVDSVIISNDLVNAQELNNSRVVKDNVVIVNNDLQIEISPHNENTILETQTNSVKIPEVVKEKIQSLTSEWSEDELEMSEQGAESNVSDLKANTVELEKSSLNANDISNISADADEIEESIENIQQEMEKQMAETVPVSELNVSSKVEKNNHQALEDIHTESELPNNGNVQPEQISSLLNDWEDNDEQQEEGTPEEDLETSQQSTVTEPMQEPSAEVEPKDDKIKSLVSDWDDDEDNKV